MARVTYGTGNLGEDEVHVALALSVEKVCY